MKSSIDTIPETRSNGSKLRLAVRLLSLHLLFTFVVATASAHSVSDFFTCKSALMEAPHDQYVRQTVFQDTDEKFYAWVEVRNVSGSHAVALKLYRPDATYYGEQTNAIKSTAIWWRMVASWRIKNDKPAQTPGRWKMDLVIDGAIERSIYFDIASEDTPLAGPAQPDEAPGYSITDFVTCESALMEGLHDQHVPRAGFQTTEDKFFVWVELKNVSGTIPVDMNLYRPDGTYYGEENSRTAETNRTAAWWRMVALWPIKDHEPAKTPGRWRLDLVIDGALKRSVYLDINPVTLDAKTFSANESSKACIIEVSPDLRHWTPIQTNAFPTNLPQGTTDGNRGYRLKIAPDLRSYVIESSTDLLKWVPLLTNNLQELASPAAFGTATATAQFYRAAIR